MKILIAGTGWLGEALYESMNTLGFDLFATAKDKEKYTYFVRKGWKVLEINFNSNFEIQTDFDVIVCCLSPSKTNDYTNVVAKLSQSSKVQFILISSTGVYKPSKLPLTEVDERISSPLASAEDEVLKQKQDKKIAIIRFGGLIGYDRHPVKYLAKKSILNDPDGSVNLIHRDDCIEIIKKVIEVKFEGILNAVSPEHPDKYNYYQYCAEKLGFQLPEKFDYHDDNKLINGEFLEKTLSYSFKKSIFDMDKYNLS